MGRTKGLEFIAGVRQWTDSIQERVAPVGQGPVMDLACGVGRFTRQIAEVFPNVHVTGVDIDPISIDHTNGQSDLPSNLDYITGSAYQLNQYYGNLGIITVMDALHHFDDIENAIFQMARSLKTNGILIISDFDRSRILEGISHQTLQFLYHQRETKTDGECLTEFERRRYFETNRKTMALAKKLSLMAAYTSEEVRDALTGNGLVPLEAKRQPFPKYVLFGFNFA